MMLKISITKWMWDEISGLNSKIQMCPTSVRDKLTSLISGITFKLFWITNFFNTVFQHLDYVFN